jgi:hypothetical protein
MIRVLALLTLIGLTGCTPDDPVGLGDTGATPGGGPGPGPGPTTDVDPTLPVVTSSTPCAACGGDCLVEELWYPGRYHDPMPIEYTVRPPAGGPHNPCWATFGVHAEPVPDDNWVHNLEHGAVVYLYACGDAPCPDEIAQLTALADARGELTLVTPYDEMDVRFAAVAWQVRMLTGCVDAAAFDAFWDERVDQAPESVASDPSTACM